MLSKGLGCYGFLPASSRPKGSGSPRIKWSIEQRVVSRYAGLWLSTALVTFRETHVFSKYCDGEVWLNISHFVFLCFQYYLKKQMSLSGLPMVLLLSRYSFLDF